MSDYFGFCVYCWRLFMLGDCLKQPSSLKKKRIYKETKHTDKGNIKLLDLKGKNPERNVSVEKLQIMFPLNRIILVN